MKQLIPSFILYAISLFGLFASDFVIITTYDDVRIAEWAFLKSYLFICSIFIIRGADQLIVRSPFFFRTILKDRVKEIFFIFPLLIVVTFFLTESVSKSFFYTFSVIAFGFLTIYSARERALGFFSSSQFLSNTWKFFFLVLVAFFEPKISLILSLLCISIIGFLIVSKRVYLDDGIAQSGINSNDKLASWFFLHNITVVASLYLEQIILSKMAGQSFAAEIYKYNIIFSSVALSLNGFVGFVLLPKLKKINLSSKANLRKLWLWLLAYVIFATFASISVGLVYVKFNSFNVDYTVLMVLALLCFFRGAYIYPSAILGLKANLNQLKYSALYQSLILLVYIVSMVILIKFFTFSVTAIFVLITINFAARFFLSLIYSNRALKNV